MRQTETRPKSKALKAWSEFQLTRFPSNSDHAKPLLYTLNRWNAFTLCLADILARNHHHKTNRLDVLPPWNWKPFANQAAAA